MGSHIQRVMVLSTQFVALLGCLSLAVDAIPAPVPQPAPEPFFGLGLLGRLLAAYSRGEKEEDFGNSSVTGEHSTQRRRTRTRIVPVTHTALPWDITLPLTHTNPWMTTALPSPLWPRMALLPPHTELPPATASAKTGEHSTRRRRRRT